MKPQTPERIRRRLGRLYGRVDQWRTRRLLEHRFDAPPQVSRVLLPEQMGLSSYPWPEGSGRGVYVPSHWGALKSILPPREVSSDDVLVDFGCGAGRMLLEAAYRYPLKRVIGVDVVPELVQVARESLAANRGRLRCKQFELVVGDVRGYEVPDDVTLAYMFRPVAGPDLDFVLESLAASVDRNPRRLWLIFHKPPDRARLEGTRRLRFVRYGRRRFRRWRPAEYLALYEVKPAATASSSP